MVRREQRGRHAIYSLSDGQVDALLAMTEEIIADLADAVNSCPHCTAREAQ